ncbi:MAG: EthD family reductase [Bacteroidota bacterium]
MTKLFALYPPLSDEEDFEARFRDHHLPLLKRCPGLRGLAITRITGSPPGGPRFHMLAELAWDSPHAMNESLASPEGRAMARDMAGLGRGGVTVYYGETAAEGGPTR